MVVLAVQVQAARATVNAGAGQGVGTGEGCALLCRCGGLLAEREAAAGVWLVWPTARRVRELQRVVCTECGLVAEPNEPPPAGGTTAAAALAHPKVISLTAWRQQRALREMVGA